MLTVDHDPRAQRLSTQLEGERGVLDYELHGNVMSITHTHVAPPIEGRGVAAELMRTALELASTHGWTVRPICSYAVAYLQRHARKDAGGAG